MPPIARTENMSLPQAKIWQAVRDWDEPSVESYRFHACRNCPTYSDCFNTRHQMETRPPFHSCREKNKRLHESLQKFFTEELDYWCDMAGLDPAEIRASIEGVPDISQRPDGGRHTSGLSETYRQEQAYHGRIMG